MKLIDDTYIRETIYKRKEDAHKGDFGKVLIYAGSPGMAGAAILCGTVIAVRFLMVDVLPRVRYIRAAIALVIAAAGFGALALMFGPVPVWSGF